jgi:hypothetical protein
MSIEGPPGVSTVHRLAVALTAGVTAAAFIAYIAAFSPPMGDALSDFDQLWFAAGVLLRGGDPYAVIGPHAGAEFRYPWGLYYPLTTVVAALPLAVLPLPVARALFVAVPAGWLGWVLAGRESWRPLWLLSYGVLYTVRQAQWSLLATASALTPALGGLLVLKPQIAIPWVLASMSWRLVRNLAVAGLALLAVSLVLDPHWVPRWLEVVRGANHVRPLIVRPLGWLMLLALLRWRRFEARLLVAFMFAPINPLPYELTALAVVPATRGQMLLLATATWVTALAQEWCVVRVAPADVLHVGQDVLILGSFVPALVMVLLRPNEGTLGDVPKDLAAGGGRVDRPTLARAASHVGRRLLAFLR